LIISASCAVIHSRPPVESVARDSRRAILPPSKAAIVNLVPPISIAKIISHLASQFANDRPVRCRESVWLGLLQAYQTEPFGREVAASVEDPVRSILCSSGP